MWVFVKIYPERAQWAAMESYWDNGGGHNMVTLHPQIYKYSFKPYYVNAEQFNDILLQYISFLF